MYMTCLPCIPFMEPSSWKYVHICQKYSQTLVGVCSTRKLQHDLNRTGGSLLLCAYLKPDIAFDISVTHAVILIIRITVSHSVQVDSKVTPPLEWWNGMAADSLSSYAESLTSVNRLISSPFESGEKYARVWLRMHPWITLAAKWTHRFVLIIGCSLVNGSMSFVMQAKSFIFTEGNVTSIAYHPSTSLMIRSSWHSELRSWLLSEFHSRCLNTILVQGIKFSHTCIDYQLPSAAVTSLCFHQTKHSK